MKTFLKLVASATLATVASSCSSFLDINTNPNSFTSDSAPTPNAILAQALATTASNYSTNYNSYASFAVDYWGKSGIVSGYASERTYNYTNSYYQSLWTNTYDNLLDYNTIQVQGAANNYPYHAAVARIMKVYNYLLLVDEYGNIPYSKALQGLNNLSPTYDDAATIYKDFIVQLDGAISDIDAADNSPITPIALGAEDIVFQGNTRNWKRFANSLKLRILLRESQTQDAALNSYVATQMTALQGAADGFITTDVVAQPGYAQSTGQQNPFYNRYGLTIAGTAATERSYQLPSNFILRAYTNNTTQTYVAGVSDPRVQQLYSAGKNNGVTQYVGTDAGEPNPPLVSSQLSTYASRFALGRAFLSGPTASTPLMLLSEHLFSKAEAETRGLFTGGDAFAKDDFNNGILASFMTFYRAAGTAPSAIPAAPATSSIAGVSQYVAYMAAAATPTAGNPKGNPNVVYDAAPSNGTLGKQYVILFQKYLAENTLASTEAWDDFRRTAQPKIMMSLQAALGKFPNRLFYPLVEVNTNTANVPQGVNQYSKIFWDVVD